MEFRSQIFFRQWFLSRLYSLKFTCKDHSFRSPNPMITHFMSRAFESRQSRHFPGHQSHGFCLDDFGVSVAAQPGLGWNL